MTSNVSLLTALLAGVISFLSPCVLPLVPPYLVYLTGEAVAWEGEGDPPRHVTVKTLASSLLFIAGFSTIFVALGASASLIGETLRVWSGVLSVVAGIAIIVMGLHFLGLTRIDALLSEHRLPIPKPVGLWGAYAMGLAFAFGWTPCIGPVLAAILAVAASEATVARGAGLLAVYSVGLGVPFLIAAIFIEPFAHFLARFRRHIPVVEKAMGVLLVLTGFAFLTGVVSQASFWLLETFPFLGTIG